MDQRIKKLVEQAGLKIEEDGDGWVFVTDKNFFEKFAELVRQDEREACAMECIKLASSWARLGAWGTKTDFHECAKAIRARGEK